MLAHKRAITEGTIPTDALLNAVLDHAIAILDPDGIVTHWNEGAQRIHQYAPEEIIGKHFSMLYAETERAAGDPEQALTEALANTRYIREGWRIRKDASRFWANVIIEAVRAEDGILLGFVKTVRDETERRRSEEALQRTTAALMQAQKMEAVGQLTGGVAHDFNNLLTVIVNSLDFLSRSVTETRQVRLVDIAQQAASRGARLTQQLLAFSRRQPLRPDVCNLNDVVTGFETVLRRACGETIDVTIRLTDGLKPVEIDIPQFEAALLNLAVNARDAMPSGGRLTITSDRIVIRQGDKAVIELAGQCALEKCPLYGQKSRIRQSGGVGLAETKSGCALADLPEGEYVFIAVMDTGEGMSASVLERVFDPFFTTKEVGKGTGLGLSQVYGFVTQSGGHISIDSAKGDGTAVWIYLPTTDHEPRRSAGDPENRFVHRTGGMVLIVEDEAGVRDIAAQLFSDMGFTTLMMGDGPSALEILRSNREIELLFSDIVMPGGMTGLELAQQARALRPDLKVVLASGYPMKTLLADNTDDNIVFVKKPYRIADLLKVLQFLG